MLIEILPRIWIADKKHQSSEVQNIVYIEKELNRKVYSIHNFIERQHEYARYLKEMVKFLYYYSVLKMKSIVLVDKGIHERQDAYMILIAYMKYYGKITWKDGYQHVKKKTIPFQLSSFSSGVLDLFHVS